VLKPLDNARGTHFQVEHILFLQEAFQTTAASLVMKLCTLCTQTSFKIP